MPHRLLGWSLEKLLRFLHEHPPAEALQLARAALEELLNTLPVPRGGGREREQYLQQHHAALAALDAILPPRPPPTAAAAPQP